MRIGIGNWVIQTLLFCLIYLKMVCWEIKMLFLMPLFHALFAKWLKVKHVLFPSGAYRASTCFETIHSDVWGMSLVVSHAHYKYFVTFIVIIVVLLGYIFFGLNVKCFLCLRNF
jgi:hypothetical protein